MSKRKREREKKKKNCLNVWQLLVRNKLNVLMNNKLLFPTQSLFSNNCIQTKYVKKIKKMTSFKVVKIDISIFYLMVKRIVYSIKNN
jgi:hypothetical protein